MRAFKTEISPPPGVAVIVEPLIVTNLAVNVALGSNGPGNVLLSVLTLKKIGPHRLIPAIWVLTRNLRETWLPAAPPIPA